MVTAAVKGMTVPQMRKLLSEIRTHLANQTMVDPFLCDQKLSNDQCMHEFAVQVTLGIHEKRVKNKKIMKQES